MKKSNAHVQKTQVQKNNSQKTSECSTERHNEGIEIQATGARRSLDCSNVPYDLISPIGLRRVANAHAEGNYKYGEYNWEKGMSVRCMLQHALGHIFNYLMGDRSEDHLGHAAWNLLGACHSEEQWPHLNNNMRDEDGNPPQTTYHPVS
jgi:hypothetical protein